MSRVSRSDRAAAEAAHRVTERAIRRLGILEWVIMFGAMLMALGGGALVAWLIGDASGWGFRPTWVVASLVLFVVPGAIAVLRLRREEMQPRDGAHSNEEEADG